MKPIHTLFSSLLLGLLLPGRSPAESATTNLPRSAARPADAQPMRGLRVHQGLRVERVADRQLVESPAALVFDPQGRLFVAEWRDHPGSDSSDAATGRVRLLEDTDADGVFDTSVVFADQLQHPSAIAWFRGGVLVATRHELVFLHDRDGDQLSDTRRTLVTFQSIDATEDAWRAPRSLTWGPDQRVYVGAPDLRSVVANPREGRAEPLNLRGGGFSLHPHTLELRTEPGDGVFGQTFDAAGRRFLTTRTEALAFNILRSVEVFRNPYAPRLPATTTILAAGMSYRPWRCLIYLGHAYAPDLHGQAFLADPVSGTVDTVSLHDGTRPPHDMATQAGTPRTLIRDEQNMFRPTGMVTGPDDLLYIADFGRTDFPPRQPPGNDSDGEPVVPTGRIWRLLPSKSVHAPPALPDFSDSAVLPGALAQSNSWIRQTAERALSEQPGKESIAILRRMLTLGKSPGGRLAALRALNGAGAAGPRELTQGMNDPDPVVRLASIGMTSEYLGRGQLAGSLGDALAQRCAEPSPDIRLHATLALGSVQTSPTVRLLSQLYRRTAGDAWMRTALLSVEPGLMAPLFVEALGYPDIRETADGQALLAELATSIGLGAPLPTVSRCLATLRDLDAPPDQTLPLVTALAEGLEGRGLRLTEAVEPDEWLGIAQTAQTLMVAAAEEGVRTAAVRVLSACLGPDLTADEYFLLMLGPGLPESMQIPVIEALARQGAQRDYEALAQRWHLWNPPQQLATLDALLETPEGAEALLTALAEKTIPMDALTSIHVRLLRAYPTDAIRARAERILGTVNADRTELVADFLETAEQPGSIAHGRRQFQARCAFCHQSGDRSFGPPRAHLRERSPVQLVAAIIDPSRDMAVDRGTTVLQLNHDRMAWGIVRELNREVIELTTPRGTRRFLREAVQVQAEPDWSLMPDNIAAGLTRQDLSDLVHFIRSDSSP